MSWAEFLTLAPGSDRITVELFQILKDDAVESAALNMQYAQNMQYAGSRQEVILTLRAGERMGFPSGSDGKESACNAGDHGLIPGLGRSAGEETGYPLQYSCLENPMDGGAWRATAHGVAKSQT